MSQQIKDEAKYKDAKYIVITDFDGTITLLVSTEPRSTSPLGRARHN